MTTGELIKQARDNAGLTQKQLANKLCTSPQNLAQYESNRRNPKLSTLQKIAAALGIPVTELLASSEIETFETGTDFQTCRNEIIEGIKKADAAESERLERLTTNFRKLNAHGQETALERVSEMVQLPQYTEGRAESITVSYGADGTIKITDQITEETAVMIDGKVARDASEPEVNSCNKE